MTGGQINQGAVKGSQGGSGVEESWRALCQLKKPFKGLYCWKRVFFPIFPVPLPGTIGRFREAELRALLTSNPGNRPVWKSKHGNKQLVTILVCICSDTLLTSPWSPMALVHPPLWLPWQPSRIISTRAWKSWTRRVQPLLLSNSSLKLLHNSQHRSSNNRPWWRRQQRISRLLIIWQD